MHLSQKKTVNMEQVWELKPENLHVNCFSFVVGDAAVDMPAQLCTHDAMLQEASGCPSQSGKAMLLADISRQPFHFCPPKTSQSST